MHSFFAALFTLVFSFSHAASVRRGVSLETVATGSNHSFVEYTPNRRDLMRSDVGPASYAGLACLSCRKMNVVYRQH